MIPPNRLIDVRNLTKKYGQVAAFDGCTLSIRGRRGIRPAGTKRLWEDHAFTVVDGISATDSRARDDRRS